MRKIPELLSPAGNFEKLKSAIRYGADAVYLSGKIFGMRSAADNFSVEELRCAIEYAHSHNVKIYLTVNTMPREHEYPMLREYFKELEKMPPDALIVADIGVLMLAREMLPCVDLHMSTQANSVSSAACRAWQALGVKRVVLARELTLEEIKAIRANIPSELELEAFVHGSMCIAYSGRCLMSGFFTGRDANRGACTQPCRWNYTIAEEKRPDIPLPVEEINGETFVMSSKDTCTIEHISELVECGIDSFKIEGRMKSSYYTAVVTNTYRMALDLYKSGDYFYNPKWMTELESVSHREYHTGYYFDNSRENANTCKNGGYMMEKAYLATVIEYDKEKEIAFLEQKNKLTAGSFVEILTPGRVGERFLAEKLFDEDGNPIESAPHPQMKFYMTMPIEAKPGDIIRISTQQTEE